MTARPRVLGNLAVTSICDLKVGLVLFLKEIGLVNATRLRERCWQVETEAKIPLEFICMYQTSKSYITGVETSEITGLTVCGSVISNPVFICIFTLHADGNWLENERNQNWSALQSLIMLL